MKPKNIKTHPECTEVAFRDPVRLTSTFPHEGHTYAYVGQEPLELTVTWGEGAVITEHGRRVWVPWDNIKYVNSPVPHYVPESERHEGEKVLSTTKVVLKKKGKE